MGAAVARMYIGPGRGADGAGMSTPYMLTAGIARRALVSLSWFWAVAFVIGRLHALHEAYISISQRLQDERYLLERCQVHAPDAYAVARRHRCGAH